MAANSPTWAPEVCLGQIDDDATYEPMSTEEEVPPHFVHPDAMALFRVAPWLRRVPILGRSFEVYGPRCTSALGLVYFLSKGLGNNLLTYAKFPMFSKRFGIDGTRYQRLSGIAKMGWSIKALTAMLTDTFAAFGYTKRWYCAASCIAGVAFTVALGALPARVTSADIGAGFLFLASYGMANVDILSEGHYSRLMRRRPEAGPALVSWIWWFIMIAGLLAAAVQGPLSDHQLPQVGVFISAAAQLFAGLFFIVNWYGELTNREERAEDERANSAELRRLHERLAAAADGDVDKDAMPSKDLHPELVESPTDSASITREATLQDDLNHEPAAAIVTATCVEGDIDFEQPDTRECLCGAFEFNKTTCMRHWRVLVYSVIMTCAVIAMTCVTILGGIYELLYVSIVVAVVCCGASFWALPLMIAKVNVFMYFHLLLYLQLPGALDSFYLADEACLPGGPHFSYSFYNTISSVIGNVAGIAGVTAFTYLFSKRSYQLTFVITTIVQIIASVFDIIIVKRWNVSIHIPDHVMYILGDAVVYEVCYMLAWMPMVILLSRICPRGSESMVYALVAGFGNLGQSMSSTIGSLIMELAWPIDTKSKPCDFRYVPWLLLVGHILMPLGIIPLSYLLIPRGRICDDLDVDGDAVKAAKKVMDEKKRREDVEAAQRRCSAEAVPPTEDRA